MMKRVRKNTLKLICFAAAVIIAVVFACAMQGGGAYAESFAPVITLVSQSPNDTYAKTKSAYLTFEDISTNETNGITDVTLDGVSLGAITSYNLVADENGSHTFVATNAAEQTSSYTVTFEKIHTTAVTVTSNLGIGVQTGGGEYTGGDSYTVSATTVDGYYFTGWTYSGTSSGSIAELSATVQVGEPSASYCEYNYVANYAEITTSNPAPYTYYGGDERKISFTPQEGFSSAVSYLYSRDADGYYLNRAVSAPILAGTYTATVDIVNSATLQAVGKKNITIIIYRGIIDTLSLPSGNFVYDGGVKRLAVAGLLPDGTTAHVKSWQNNARTVVGTTAGVSAVVAGGNNYADLTLSGGVITVAKRPVSITAINKFRQYGYEYTETKRSLSLQETDPYSFEFFVSGGFVVSGETLVGCFALQDPNVAIGASTEILQGTLNNDSNPNYDITFIGGTLTAVRRILRILINNATYEYGEPVVTEIGFTLLDTVKSGETLYGAPSAAAAQGTGAGIYPFANGFTLSDTAQNDTTDNYDIVLTSSASAISTPYTEITPRRVTVDAVQNQSLVYNGQLQLPIFALQRPDGAAQPALYSGDTLDYDTYINAALAESADAGEYSLYISGTNYCFYINGGYYSASQEILFVIIPKEISTVTYHNNGNLIYNGSEQKNITATSDDIYERDAGFVLSVSYSGDMKDAGSYTYTAYIDTSVGSGNYYLSPSIQPNAIEISPKGIVVVADNVGKRFGYANPVLTYTANGITEGDSLLGMPQTDADLLSPIGVYTITSGNLYHPNYVITFIEGILEISKENIKISADNISRLYYENNPKFTYSVIEGKLITGIPLSGALYAYDALTLQVADKYSACGEYAIGSTLTNPNYNIDIISGTLTVSPRPINFVFYNDNLFPQDGCDKRALVAAVSHDIPEPIGYNISYTLIKSAPAAWIAAGLYTFTVALSGANADNYYWDDTEEFEVRISSRRALVTVADQVITFGDSLNPYLYSVVSENTGAVMSVLLTLTIRTMDAGDHYNAIGIAETTAVIDSISYDLTVFGGNLTVLKRRLNLVWGNTDLIYNGEIQAPPTVTASGGFGDISVSAATDRPLFYPGSYTATATLNGNDADNHYLPAGASATVVIAMQPPFADADTPPTIYGIGFSNPDAERLWVNAPVTLEFYVAEGTAPVAEVAVNGVALTGNNGYYTYLLSTAAEFTITATDTLGLVTHYKGRALVDTEAPHIALSNTENFGVWMPDDFISVLTLSSTSSMSRVYYRRALYGTLIEDAVWYCVQNLVFDDHNSIIDFIFQTAEGRAQDTAYEFKIINGVGEDEYVTFNYKVDRRDYKITYIDKWHDGTDSGEYSYFVDTGTDIPAAGSFPRGTTKSLTIKGHTQNNLYRGLQVGMITVINTASASQISFSSVVEYLEYRTETFTLSSDNPDTMVGVTVTAIFKNYVEYKINDVSKEWGEALPVFTVTAIKGTPEVGTTHYGITTAATASSPIGEYPVYAPIRITTSQISRYSDGVLSIIRRKIILSGTVTKIYDRNDTADISALTVNRVLAGEEVFVASAVYAGGEVNAGNHPLTITLGGADVDKYELGYPVGQSAYFGTITPYGLVATGGQTTYVFDGGIKQYAPTVSGVLQGDEPPTFTFIYENGELPIFANRYRAIDCISDNPNYTITSYPEGIHLTITANNTLSAKRIIMPNGNYRILLILDNMASMAFASLSNTQIIYSVNGSSFFGIEADRFSAQLTGDTVEITYLGKPGMRVDLADSYYFQIGVDDDLYYNDSTNFTFTVSALFSGQAETYYSGGTPIYTAEELKTFLNGTGNGYLCNNIYSFDWGGGGSTLIFESDRVLDGNGFTVYLTGDYDLPELEQPLNPFTSFKSWYATGLFVGINHGTIRNISFKYSGNRSYISDTCNSANSGRAIGFISGANSGTIRNAVITLAGNFRYHSSLGISFGYLAVGGITGVAYENSTIINCTVEHIGGTYALQNHANNTWTYLAFGGAVGFMNGNGNTVKTNGYYDNATLINSKVTGNQTNIILDGRFSYGGGLIGSSMESSNNGYYGGIVDGVINSYSGQITADTTGYKGQSFKNIGMVGGFVTNLYNVYNTYSYNHINLTGLKNVPSIMSVGRDTEYFHIVVFSGTERNPIAWGGFPQSLITTELPSVRMDTSVVPNVPMGNGIIGFYFDKLDDGNKAGDLLVEIIAYFRTFIWDVKSTSGEMIYTIADYIPYIIDNEDLENNLIQRWIYPQTLGSQTVLDTSFGVRAYGTVDGVVNGYLNYTYNGRNQRERVLEAIKIKDESGDIVDGYELIVNAPYNMKDAGTYVVTFVNIVSGSGSGGEGFAFNEESRSIIYISSLDEQSNAIQVIIEKKDAQIANPFPIALAKEYDGTDFMLFSAQYYLEGFTEVLSEGETSPLSIRFTFASGNINTVNGALVYGDLVYIGDPTNVIPNNYNLIGATEFLGSIVPRIVTVNIPFEVGELPYAYCGKEYDGNDMFAKTVSLNNVLTHLDPDIYVIGRYFDNYEASTPSRNVGDNKVLRFILQNDTNNNYAIVDTQQTYLTQIYKRTISIIGDNMDKIYDGSVYMSEAQLAGFTFDRAIVGDDVRIAIGIYNDKYVGIDKLINLTLGGIDGTNYELITPQENYLGSIYPKEISVIGSITKVYNKSYNVNPDGLYLFEICEGDSVQFTGVYADNMFSVCQSHPIIFTISGADAANYTLIGNYYGDITPLNVAVYGTISKVYDKTDTVNTATLSLSYNLDGSNLYFEGVYSGGRVNAGNGLPVTFVLLGTASANYSLIGSYYGAILPRAVSVILDGSITKIYDKTSNVLFPYPEFAVLDNRNIDGANLGFYANYAGGQKNVVASHPIIFTLTGQAASNYIVEGTYLGSITPKLVGVTYGNINQSYRVPRTNILATVNANDIISGDIVNAIMDMSRVAATHSRYTKYSGLTAAVDNPNYYVAENNNTELIFRYFMLADGEDAVYKIETVADLAMLNSKDMFNDYLMLDYIMINDIDNGKKVFQMIEGEYSGSFDGNGKTVSGLVLIHVGESSTDADYARLALFESLAAEGSISGLRVVNTSLNNYDAYTVTAGLVAYNEGSITSCIFEGEIYAGTQTSVHAVSGGLAGISSGIIVNSTAVAVIVTNSATVYTGGIAGMLVGQAALTGSTGFAEITASATTAAAGGLIGQNEASGSQNDNAYLEGASFVNGNSHAKAVGNGENVSGASYSALAQGNAALADVVYLYRIAAYAPSHGTASDPIAVNNYRQTVLLSLFGWASFDIKEDIIYPSG